MENNSSSLLFSLHNEQTNYTEICTVRKISLLEIINITFLVVVVIFGLFGNLLVVFIVCKNQNMRRNINILISNLAVSDSLVLVDDLLSAILESLPTVNPLDPEDGKLACKVLYFIYGVGPVVSLLTLLIISISRYRAVSTPMSVTPLSSRMLTLLIAGTWVLPLAFYAYDLFILTGSKPSDIMACDFIDSTFNLNFYIVQASFPLLIFLNILIINIFILRKLHQAQVTINLPPEPRKARTLRIRNAVRMVLCSLLLYTILWVPLNILYSLSSISMTIFDALQSDCFETIRSVAFVFITLHAVNSAVSPIVYVAFLEDFRHALKNLFRTSRSRVSDRHTGLEMNKLGTHNAGLA